MQALRLLPALLGTWLLAAHLFRAGLPLAVALALIALPLVLVGARRPAVRAVQLVLLLGAVEWVRTLVLLMLARRAAGLPHLRLAVILGAVALLTVSAAASLESWRRHRRRPVAAVTAAA